MAGEYIKVLGIAAYVAYCQATGGVSLVSGDKLPKWEDLSIDIQTAWIAAAEAVSEEIMLCERGKR